MQQDLVSVVVVEIFWILLMFAPLVDPVGLCLSASHCVSEQILTGSDVRWEGAVPDHLCGITEGGRGWFKTSVSHFLIFNITFIISTYHVEFFCLVSNGKKTNLSTLFINIGAEPELQRLHY